LGDDQPQPTPKTDGACWFYSQISDMNHQPKCIIVTGRPGSGKTTFSRKLGRQLWMPVVSRDEIKEGYVNTHGVKHDQLPPDTNGVVNEFFFSVVNQYLSHGVSIIIEAAFQHKVWEPRISTIRELGQVFIIICSVDAETAAKRHLQRGLDESDREFYHGDKRVAIYRETGEISSAGEYEEPSIDMPTIRVSTENKYSPTIEEVVTQIRAGIFGP